MGFKLKKESYTGAIKQVSIGKGDSSLTVGGDTCYPFYTFEGEMVNKPIIAMEIWDIEPLDWPEPALAHFKDVAKDPAAWAQKCVEEFGAEAIVLQLKSIDPNDMDASPESAAETVKKVRAAIKVPLIVWGCAAPAKDEEVLKAVAAACQDENLVLGPVEEKNYKGIAAAAMGYNHSLIASSPIDVNLAKQVNILLENFGMPMDRVLVDPTTGGLGYGMEYSYSVMERLTMAAMAQGDEKLQYPMINNLGNEVWKCKEAKQSAEEAPTLGDPERRGILMEAVGAVAYLMSGSNILIMRHPESIKLTKAFIDSLTGGGPLDGVKTIEKILSDANIDLTQYSPVPDLTIKDEEKPVVEKKAPPPKKEAPVAKQQTKEEESKEKTSSKTLKLKPPPNKPGRLSRTVETSSAISAQPELTTEQLAEIEEKKQLAAEAAAKAQKEKAEQEEKTAREAAEAEARAQEAAKKAAEKDARLAREQEEKELKAQRAHKAHAPEQVVDVSVTKATPAAVQKTETEKILDTLNRFHKRV